MTGARHGTTVAGDLDLAAGWYIAARADTVRRRPVPLDLFGRQLVAWRDGTGRAVLMPRHCAHLGASLALGKVVDGCLRCPFHHWRYDATGTCVDIPGATGLTRTARLRTYPLRERHGYLWAWYGGPRPAYELPEVPALDTPERYLTYRFRHSTPASPRRVLENAFDFYHFMTLHQVRSREPVELDLLDDPSEAADNGPPIPAEAWIGARLRSRGLHVPAPIRALGLRTDTFSLLVDGWPGGQRLTFYLDGRMVAKELLGVTPVAAGRTVMQGWTLVPRSGFLPRDLTLLLMYRAQHWQGTREDLAVYRHAADVDTPVPVRYDRSVLRFRRFWAGWVDRAEATEAATAPAGAA
ncbi:Rieske 2Fe-2S domain-containing protein [Dactylosporangium sp. NPDC050688]|uniref:Rieske 2Fe-2S domain-containing protein n=1 Tax=Dactylosporangium sp. NPDC050688 TaxID=3157217 RepID=UPI0033C76BA0